MSHILVVDELAIFREPITASLVLAGHKAVCAPNSAEAIKLISQQRPELIILDVAMIKNGSFALLRFLQTDSDLSAIPVIALTAVANKQLVVQSAAHGVKDYLLKSRFRLKELLDRISNRLTEAESTRKRASSDSSNNEPAAADGTPQPMPAPQHVVIPQLMTRDECIQRAESAFQTKTLSGVVAQVVSLAGSPRTDLSQLAELISRDPMLSARVLQAANSAAYTSSRGIVTTIPDAIRNVGSSTVRNIAAALGIFDVMPETNKDGFNPIRCWQHSFAVAQICERLVGGSEKEEAGVAYLVGLCHDLGDILAHTQFGSEFEQVMDLQTKTGKPREQLEYEMLGMTHSELVGIVFNCMNLPDTIRQPVEIMHSAARERTDNRLAKVLWMAEMHANSLLLASSPLSGVAPLPGSLCQSATSNANPAHENADSLRSTVLCLTAMLARLSKKEEESLLMPMFQRKQVRIWVAREPALSSFDPVSTALESMAEVEPHDRLPMSAELELYDAVIVTSRSTASARFTKPEMDSLTKACAKTQRRMLWICNTIERSVESCGCAAVQAPIPLAELAQFVASVESRTLTAAA